MQSGSSLFSSIYNRPIQDEDNRVNDLSQDATQGSQENDIPHCELSKKQVDVKSFKYIV
jgi:hypothetical protein